MRVYSFKQVLEVLGTITALAADISAPRGGIELDSSYT
jgi:hypothetical protein